MGIRVGAEKGGGEQESKEPSDVSFSNAIIYPWTMMIESTEELELNK